MPLPASATASPGSPVAPRIKKKHVIPAMSALRVTVDALETLSSAGDWPYPSYGDILFSVK